METSIRVFLVHSDEVIREGLLNILEFCEGIEVVGEAANVERALALVAHLAPDVLIKEYLPLGAASVEAIPEFTLSIFRDREGRPIVNMTAYKDREPPGEVTVVGRQSECRVQVIDVGPGGYRVTESKREELANAIVLAAREDLALGMASGHTFRSLTGANGQKADLATNGHKNRVASGNGVTGDALPRTNGHANGAGNGKVVTESAHPGANGHANDGICINTGGSNEQPVAEGAQAENNSEGWFGRVSIRQVKPSDGTADEERLPSSEDLSRDLPEGTEILDDPAIHWETAQQEVQEAADEPWMNIWELQSRHNATEKIITAETELVFAPSVGPKDLYNLVLQLKKATRAEIKETSGSLTGETSVKVVVDRAAPLLEIIRAMPEVAEVKAEITPENGRGPFASSSLYLPQKISVDLKTAEEVKPEVKANQLELALEYNAPVLK